MPKRIAMAGLVMAAWAAGWADNRPECDRYALHHLSPGMSDEAVRRNMGGEGLRVVMQVPGVGETSAVDYPGPPSDIHVQYDHRVDRRPRARVVLVRTSMSSSPSAARELIERFGAPHAGAEDLGAGLHEGAAVWVDESCGVVVTAYRPPACWWTGEGGALLQVESIDFTRQGGSPASSRLIEILARHPATPAVQAVAAWTPDPEPQPPPEREPVPASIYFGAVLEAAPAHAAPVRPSPQILETWHQPALSVGAPKAPAIAKRPAAPPTPQTLATWHQPAGAIDGPLSDPPTNGPPAPLTIATWQPKGVAASAPPSTARATAPSEQPAERLTFVPPVYPSTAKWLGVKGYVKLAIVVRADGSVADSPRVVTARPAGLGFEPAAVAAARAWQFKPAFHAGKPVASRLEVAVEFE